MTSQEFPDVSCVVGNLSYGRGTIVGAVLEPMTVARLYSPIPILDVDYEYAVVRNDDEVDFARFSGIEDHVEIRERILCVGEVGS